MSRIRLVIGEIQLAAQLREAGCERSVFGRIHLFGRHLHASNKQLNVWQPAPGRRPKPRACHEEKHVTGCVRAQTGELATSHVDDNLSGRRQPDPTFTSAADTRTTDIPTERIYQ